MFGNNTGTLAVDGWINNAWQPLDSITGEQQNATTDAWLKRQVTATGVGANFKVRLRSSRTNGTNGDIAIDDFRMVMPSPTDLAVANFTYPIEGGCGSASDSVSVNIINVGTQVIDFSTNAATVTVTTTGTATPPAISSTINAGTLATGDTLNVYVGQGNFSVAGNYILTAAVAITGDGDFTNDTSDLSFNSTGLPITSTTYSEDFESFTVATNATGFNNGWSADPENTTSQYRWNVGQGTTPNTATGPSGDHTSATSTGNGSGKYIYIEASQGTNGAEASLYSPCIDLDVMTNPAVTFWYHMYGANASNINVDVNVNGVWQNSVQTIFGPQQLASTDPWLQGEVNLSSYSGVVRLRFRATKTGFNGDVAIDDIQIRQLLSNNTGVSRVVTPYRSCNLTETTQVSVMVTNYGEQPQSNIPVYYAVDGVQQTGILAGPIAPRDSALFTFTDLDATANLHATGEHTITAWTDLSGDENAADDEITHMVAKYKTPTPVNTFTGFTGDNLPATMTGWYERNGSGDGASDWTGISGQASIFLQPNLNEWLVMPEVTMFSQPMLRMKAASSIAFSTGDSLMLMSSTNCGATWQKVSDLAIPVSAALTPTTVSFPLTPLANTKAVLAIAAKTGASGGGTTIVLDDIEVINNTTTPDVGVSSLVNDFPIVALQGQSYPVKVMIRNYGTQDVITPVQVTRKIGFITISVTQPFSAFSSLLPGEEKEVLMGNYFAAVAQTVSGEFYTNLSSDVDKRNDTLRLSIPIVQSTGISSGVEESSVSDIAVYPNPTDGLFRVQLSSDSDLSGVMLVELYNSTGVRVLSGELSSADRELELDGRGLSSGLYVVRMRDSRGRVESRKLIIK